MRAPTEADLDTLATALLGSVDAIVESCGYSKREAVEMLLASTVGLAASVGLTTTEVAVICAEASLAEPVNAAFARNFAEQAG